MRYETDRIFGGGSGENAAVLEQRANLGGGAARPCDVKNDDVCGDGRRIELDSRNFRKFLRQMFRVVMILVKAFSATLR